MTALRIVTLVLILLAAGAFHASASVQPESATLAFEDLAELPVGTPILAEMRDGRTRIFFLVRLEGPRARLEDQDGAISLVSSQVRTLRRHPHRSRFDYVELLIRQGRVQEGDTLLAELRHELAPGEGEPARWKELHERLLALEQEPLLAAVERVLHDGHIPAAYAQLEEAASSRPEFGLVRARMADLASEVLEPEEELALLGRFLLDFPHPPGGGSVDEWRDRMMAVLEELIASAGEDGGGAPTTVASRLMPLLRLRVVLSRERGYAGEQRLRYLEEYFPDGREVRWDWPVGPAQLDLDAALFHQLGAAAFHAEDGDRIVPPQVGREVVRELTSSGQYGVSDAWKLEEEPRQRALQFLADRACARLIIASAGRDYEEAKAQALAILEVFEVPRVRSLSVGNLPMVVGERPRAPRAGGIGRGAPLPEVTATEVAGLLESLGSHHASLMLVPMLLSEDVIPLSHRHEARELAAAKFDEMTERWRGFLDRPGAERDIEERLRLIRAWMPGELSPRYRDEFGRVEERLSENNRARRDLEQLRRSVEDVEDFRRLPAIADRADQLARTHQSTPYPTEFVAVAEAVRNRHRQVEAEQLAEQRRRQEAAARERHERAEANRRALEQAARRTAEQYMEALSATANRYQRLRRLWDSSTGGEPMIVERLHSFNLRRSTMDEDQMRATVTVYMDFENEAGVRFTGEYHVRLRRPHLTASDWKVYSLEE